MAEVDISPLAKRLAEENNVDWRALEGSGDDGRIVERDVLDYLARVMAGDEAADPTPEPLPDGMQSWSDGPPMESAGRSDEEPAAASTRGGDDDLLEVESAGAPPTRTRPDDWSQGEWGADDWGAGGAASNNGEDGGDDFFAGMGDLTGEQSAGGDEGGFDFGADDGGEPFEFGSETEGRAYDLGGSPDESTDFDFATEPAAKDRSVFDTSSMEPAIDEGIFVFDDEEPPQAEAAGASSGSEDAAAEAADGPTVGSFEFGDEKSSAPADSESSFDFGGEAQSGEEDTEHTPWESAGATAAEVEQEVAASAEDLWEQDRGETSDLPSSDAPWTAVSHDHSGEPARPEQPAGPLPATAEYDYLDRADESLPDGVRIEEDEYRVVRSGATGVAAVAATAEPATRTASSAHDARGAIKGGGIVLRREVDITAVVEASKALAVELGEEPSLAAFLLRAAARAGSPWPLESETDEVALANLSDDGVGVSVVSGARDMQFRDLIGASNGTANEGGDQALAVADVSEMGIDEAVLELGSPVLTIGRVLESGGGRMHATLTLSGLSAPESGSRFLGRVADLLAAPVRLVL